MAAKQPPSPGIAEGKPTEVTLVPGTLAETSLADDLYADLERELQGMGTQASVDPAWTHWNRVVVLLGTAIEDEASRTFVKQALDEMDRAEETMKILPALREKSNVDALKLIDPRLPALNVSWYATLATELTPAVLLASHLGRSEFRVFISYRRKDSQALADQLFNALNYRGFSVFLDRATVPVGARFQRYLTEQMEDKSMIVVLETPRFNAPWTQYEIAFARRRRLGVFSLRIGAMDLPDEAVPGTRRTHTAPPLREIDAAFRRDLAATWEFDPAPPLPNETSILSPAALKSVVEEIERRHHQAYVRRRELILADLNSALEAEGLGQVVPDRRGGYSLTLKHCPNPPQVKFLISPRPAELAHLYDGVNNDPAHTPPTTTFVLIAPHLKQDGLRGRHLSWVRKKVRVEQVDPIHLPRYAQKLKKSRCP